MAKKKGNVYGQTVVYEKTYKGTSIGRRPNTSTMNKHKRRTWKKYRGQDFRPSQGRGSCGNCGMFSQRHYFCGVYRTKGVKDTYVCNKWRPRYFKR